ncbi:MAG: hypothetical protein WC782_13410 [Methylococcaceae bacterium]|jgi:hypothetical protein
MALQQDIKDIYDTLPDGEIQLYLIRDAIEKPNHWLNKVLGDCEQTAIFDMNTQNPLATSLYAIPHSLGISVAASLQSVPGLDETAFYWLWGQCSFAQMQAHWAWSVKGVRSKDNSPMFVRWFDAEIWPYYIETLDDAQRALFLQPVHTLLSAVGNTPKNRYQGANSCSAHTEAPLHYQPEQMQHIALATVHYALYERLRDEFPIELTEDKMMPQQLEHIRKTALIAYGFGIRRFNEFFHFVHLSLGVHPYFYEHKIIQKQLLLYQSSQQTGGQQAMTLAVALKQVPDEVWNELAIQHFGRDSLAEEFR